MRMFKILLLIASVTLFAAAPALAHTELVSKTPEEGAALKQAPRQVQLSFAGPVEAEFSPLEIYDAQDRRVDMDNARLNPGDTATLTVGLKDDLPAGSYTVEYRFTGEDGHTITGSYEFAVSKQRAPEESTAAEAATDSQTAPQTVSEDGGERNPSPVEESASGGGGFANVALYVGLGIVGLAVIGMLVIRRR